MMTTRIRSIGRVLLAGLLALALLPSLLMAQTAPGGQNFDHLTTGRSEEHTSELQSLMRISYADFCLKKNNQYGNHTTYELCLTTIDRNSTRIHCMNN